MHWFPFYSSDFLGATVGLSCLERALYALMLPLYFEVGPFPTERIRIYRIIGCESDEQKRAVDYLLNTYFVSREDGWYQPKAEEVKTQQAQIQAQAVERGKRSAEVRRQVYGTAQPKASRKPFESVSKASSKGARTNQNQNQIYIQTQNHNQNQIKTDTSPPIPSWLPVDTWEVYQEHRRAMRAPLTRRAVILCLKKLGQLRDQGNNPKAVLEQSIVNGWKGVFEVEDGKRNGIDEWLESGEKEISGERL
jgi:uncharacterized protein YdaU (DUF1376 family)